MYTNNLQSSHNILQICALKHLTVEFISDHIASKSFLDKLLKEYRNDSDSIQPLYLTLFELLLQQLQQATEQQVS
jgi:hypothetical protein